MSVRAIRERARQALHDHMGEPAFYYPPPGIDAPYEYLEITARPHNRQGQIGDLPGTNLNYAEMSDRRERIVFWLDQFTGYTAIMRRALVIFSADEGYFVDTMEPPDGQTLTAMVTRADADDMQGKDYPGQCNV